MAVRKTSLAIDDAVIQQAQEILGTTGIRDTVDAALREVVRREAGRRLVEHLKQLDIDPNELRARAWGE